MTDEETVEEEVLDEIDSEATISDGKSVIISSDSDESDTELVVEDWSQKKLKSIEFECDFVHMYLAGKFSEAQGDLIIELIRKYYQKH